MEGRCTCLSDADCNDGYSCTIETCGTDGTCRRTLDNSRCTNDNPCLINPRCLEPRSEVLETERLTGCVRDPLDDGTPLPGPLQIPGDCNVIVCDGFGRQRTEPDNNDLPDDDNPCTENVCTNGVPSNPPRPAGAGCPGGVCNGQGTCVPCNQGAACNSGLPGVCALGRSSAPPAARSASPMFDRVSATRSATASTTTATALSTRATSAPASRPAAPAVRQPDHRRGQLRRCGKRCGSGETCCGGECVNTNIDETNCGGCGTSCGANQTCCSGNCRNLQNDEANCGTCGRNCSAGETCCGGGCIQVGAACDTGQKGVCSAGTIRCLNNQANCVRTTDPSPEICNGLDDDCDGDVDEGDLCPPDKVCNGAGGCVDCLPDATRRCYSGPAGTEESESVAAVAKPAATTAPGDHARAT